MADHSGGDSSPQKAESRSEVAWVAAISGSHVELSASQASGGGVATATEKRVKAESRLGTQLGNHLLTRVIGEGGMGVVYEALDSVLGRRVAIKLLPESVANEPKADERFVQEARSAARLNHQNVVSIYEIGQSGNDRYLVMELVDGSSMGELIKQSPMPWQEATRVVAQACRGLAAAHAAGLIHRDLKPANLLRGPDGVVKLTDFGLAKVTESLDAQLTATGKVVGTPAYMSPEQCHADPLDSRTDIYSLGATYFALLTGKGPFDDSQSAPKIMFAHCYRPVPDARTVIPEVPTGAVAIIRRAMAKDPDDRYPNAEALRQDLETLLSGRTPLAVGMSFRPPPAPPGEGGHNSITAYPVGGSAIVRRPALLARVLGFLRKMRSRRRPKGPQTETASQRATALGVALEPRAVSQAPMPSRLVEATPIRVGLLHSTTGYMSISEEGPIQGALLAIEELNLAGGLMGRRIECVLGDGRSDTESFAKQAESLIRDEKVCVVFGCWTSASRKTVRPIFEKYDHLLIYPVQYEGLEASPNIFCTGATPNQQLLPAVKWCFTELGKRFYLVGSDYVYPRVAHELIRDQVSELGGEVVGVRFLPLGSNDVSQVVSEIQAARPSVILNTINGDSNLAFFRELRQAGVTSESCPTMSFSLSGPEIRSIGPRDLAGDYAAGNYFMGIDKPENHAFVRRFQDKYGPQRQTSDSVESAYIAVHLWAKSVAAAGGIEPKLVRAALPNQTFDAPEGRVWMDPKSQHTWKSTRIGRMGTDGNFSIVFSSVQAIEPQPFPRFRDKNDWEELLLQLYEGWGCQWQAPTGDRFLKPPAR